MALNENTLAEALENIFESMKNEPMSNRDYAVKFAKAITDQIKTAAVPTDRVVVSVTGQAVGVKNITEITVE
jgi:hypothetical protein